LATTGRFFSPVIQTSIRVWPQPVGKGNRPLVSIDQRSLPSQRVAHVPDEKQRMGVPKRSLAACCLAEALGTFLLVLFGCGSVHAAVLTNAQHGLWQVAIVWGVAVMLAIYTVGSISGAHINPAISVALATWGRFAWKDVPGYVAGQLVGAILAA